MGSFFSAMILISNAFMFFKLVCRDAFFRGRAFFIKMLFNTVEEERVVLPMYS